MKRAAHLLLSIALLTQGAMVAAMPVSLAPAPEPAAGQAVQDTMPCHGEAKSGDPASEMVGMACCEPGSCDCAAMCSAVAVVDAASLAADPAPADTGLAAEPGEVHDAYRLKLLRPPIASFA